MSDATIVYIAFRALTLQRPGEGHYHLPSDHDYAMQTRCGIVIWANDQRQSSVHPIRRDTADRIARLCRRCAPGARDWLTNEWQERDE